MLVTELVSRISLLSILIFISVHLPSDVYERSRRSEICFARDGTEFNSLLTTCKVQWGA